MNNVHGNDDGPGLVKRLWRAFNRVARGTHDDAGNWPMTDLANPGTFTTEREYFIFLHNAKTGGKSFEALLKAVFGNRYYRYDMRVMEFDARLYDHSLALGGHSSYRHVNELYSNRHKGKRPVYCAFVRNPLDVVVSLYNWFMTRRPRSHWLLEKNPAVMEYEPEDFIIYWLESLEADNPQCRVLTSVDDIEDFVHRYPAINNIDYLLPTESLDLARKSFSGYFRACLADDRTQDLEKLVNERQNVSEKFFRREDCTDRLVRQVDRYCGLDQRLYDNVAQAWRRTTG